jgi:hypothetical protein
MMSFLNERLAGGPIEARIMAIGGNAQVSLKVQIEQIDDVGMVCRVKGMMGGLGEPQLRPWACISNVSFD